MRDRFFCRYCGTELDLGETFLYEIAVQDFEEHSGPIEAVQEAAGYVGEPLHTCKACRKSIELNQQQLAAEESGENGKDRLALRLMLGFIAFWILLGLFLSAAARFGEMGNVPAEHVR